MPRPSLLDGEDQISDNVFDTPYSTCLTTRLITWNDMKRRRASGSVIVTGPASRSKFENEYRVSRLGRTMGASTGYSSRWCTYLPNPPSLTIEASGVVNQQGQLTSQGGYEPFRSL
jgi:hypothetical protein